MESSHEIHQSWQLATYTAFFRLSVDEPTSTAYFYVELITRLIFEVSLPLSLAVKGSELFPIMEFRAIRTWWTHEAPNLNQQITSYAMAYLILANCAYMGYLIRFYRTRRSDAKVPSMLSKVMQTHILWACGPLYIPYISIPLNYISCEHVSDHCHFFKVGYAEIVFFLFLVFLHTAFCLVYSVSVFDWSPFSHYCGAQAHSRVNIEATVCKAVISIVFELVIKIATPVENFSLVIFCSIYHFFIAVSFWYDLPYFKMKMNKLMIAVYVVSFMGSISVLVRMLVDDPNDILAISMFFTGSILILPSVSILTNWRKQAIDLKPVTHLSSATDVDIKVRALIKRLQSITSNTNEAENGADMKSGQHIFEEIDEILSFHKEAYETSFKVNLIWATYVFLFKNNKFLAMGKLKKMIASEPSLFDILPLQIRIRYFSEFSSSEEAALVSFEEQLRLERHALQCITKCMSHHLRFWGTLMSDEHELKQLEQIGNEINRLSRLARSSILRMILLDPKNPSYRRIYAHFLETLVNEDEAAQRQHRYAQDFEKQMQDDTSLTSSANCIVVLSGERETMGHILEVNRTTCATFNVTRDEILGKKVNSLMPKVFAQAHDSHLINYIKKKTHVSKATISRNGIIVKFSSGFIGEGCFRVREYANFTLEPSITFFGALAIKRPRCFCLVKKNDLIVHEVTSQFYETFHPEALNLVNLKLTISFCIKHFAEEQYRIDQALEYSSSYTFCFNHTKENQMLLLSATVSNLPFAESQFYHVAIEGANDLIQGESPTFNPILATPALTRRRSSIAQDVLLPPEPTAAPSNDQPRHAVSFHTGPSNHMRRRSSFQVTNPSGPFNPSAMILKSKTFTKDTAVPRAHRAISADNDGLHISLLRWICALTFLICILAVGMQYFSVQQTLYRFQDLLAFLNIPLPSALAFAHYFFLVFQVLPNSSLPSQVTSQINTTALFTQLYTYHNAVRSLDDTLFTMHSKIGDEMTRFLWYRPIQIIDFDATEKPVPLEQAVQAHISAVGGLLRRPLRNHTDTFPFSFFPLNDPVPLISQLCEIREKLMGQQDAWNDWMFQVEFIFGVSTVGLIFFLMISKFFPSVYSHLKKKIDVYNFFESLDKGRLREMCCRSTIRMSTFGALGQVDQNMITEAEELVEVFESKWDTFHNKKRVKRRWFWLLFHMVVNKCTWMLPGVYYKPIYS
jgi:hypothetical protein